MKISLILSGQPFDLVVYDDTITFTHFSELGFEYSSNPTKLNHISSLDEETLKNWVNMNHIDIRKERDKINLTLTIPLVGTNEIILTRVSYSELLDKYTSLREEHRKLCEKYEQLYEDVSGIIVGCLDDVGQGDYICRGEHVKEQIDDILQEYG